MRVLDIPQEGLTVNEAASRWGVSSSTARRWMITAWENGEAEEGTKWTRHHHRNMKCQGRRSRFQPEDRTYPGIAIFPLGEFERTRHRPIRKTDTLAMFPSKGNM